MIFFLSFFEHFTSMRQRKGDASPAAAVKASVAEPAVAAPAPASASPSIAQPYSYIPDAICLAVLAVLATITRFWRIHDPRGIIFDEVSVCMCLPETRVLET